jgi:hypothetical protein
MCSDETCCKVRRYKYLFDAFPIQDVPKQGNAVSTLILTFAFEYNINKVKENLTE